MVQCFMLLHESELDKNDHISDSNGDHGGDGASFDCEETQACHWSCRFQLLKNENRTEVSRKLQILTSYPNNHFDFPSVFAMFDIRNHSSEHNGKPSKAFISRIDAVYKT